MLLNLSIGIGLIVGALGIPLTLLALCVGKASTEGNRYPNTANSEKLTLAIRPSGSNERADITALQKAS